MNCEHFRLIFENPKKAGIETFFLKKQKKSEEFKSTHDQNSRKWLFEPKYANRFISAFSTE